MLLTCVGSCYMGRLLRDGRDVPVIRTPFLRPNHIVERVCRCQRRYLQVTALGFAGCMELVPPHHTCTSSSLTLAKMHE